MNDRKWPKSESSTLHQIAPRQRTVGVRALVFDSLQRVLLVKHTYLKGWYTPGGGVNEREAPANAIVREIWEETGIRIEGEARLFSIYLNAMKASDDYPIMYVFENQRGTPKTNDRKEIRAVDWFPLNALPDTTTKKTIARISEFVSGKEPSPIW